MRRADPNAAPTIVEVTTADKRAAESRAAVGSAPVATLRSARQQFERDYIVFVLRHYDGRVGDAARALGIQRTNLYRKARQLGISLAKPAPLS